MALQYVGGKSFSGAGRITSENIILTDLTGGIDTQPSENDIVLVSYSSGDNGAYGLSIITAGYTNDVSLYSNDNYDVNFIISHKIMGSTPDTSVDISRVSSTSDARAVAIHVWRNINLTNPLDVTPTTATGINTSYTTPPPITPISSGAVIICSGAHGEDTFNSYSNPGFSNWITVGYPDDNDTSIFIGSVNWTSGTYTPPTVTVNNDSSAAAWAGATIALRPAAALATVTTQAVSSIAQTTATGNGNVTADGGATVSERGVCWSTSTGPTTANSKANSGTGTGAYTVSMTGLSANTLYYAKAYAINSVGTSYGSEVTFTTLAAGPTNLKTYNTNPVANIKTINTNPIANIKSLNTNT